ncbi:MAG TPA: VIT domain-containing protein [Pyrinomonadaceae bacterium]|nr:VIT domain-containing protein [Pyrinomonadaceae bacterium]
MSRKFVFRLLTTLSITAGVVLLLSLNRFSPTAIAKSGETAGALQIVNDKGEPKGVCPLKHTDVKADISGFLARVNVTQEFENPSKEKIEAVYVFPLPASAAVDDMTMLVGDRVVRGKILRREEAQAVYEAAKSNGQVASLLDQERPNVFTQSVANILPGETVKITISYVETLKYEAGSYEFSFPMVVGPRYMPGDANGKQGGGTKPDTTQVPDASRISPPLTPEGMRSGHDISIDVSIDAGVPLDGIKGKSHDVELERLTAHSAHVRLKTGNTIPNKDFVLQYDVAGKNIQDALLTHRSDKGGYFTLILQPPDRITAENVTPKELVFVLDTSGSMSGFPIDKAREAMKSALEGLYPQDTFNLITFAGDTNVLFPEPVHATPDNLKKAQEFLEGRTGGGGTEMMKAIQVALDPSDAQDHVRIVCFMTDGYVGNEMSIIGEVQKHPNARVFAFGIGSSVNRFLLDKISEVGRGEVEYVSLDDDGSAAARRFHERVRSPLLTDISIDWNGLPVSDVYPRRIPDLFGAKPVILTGRYTGVGQGVIHLQGKMAGQNFSREIAVNFPEADAQHSVISSLWARRRIDDLMSQDYTGLQGGNVKPELKEAITNLGIEFGLMTQFTSFVAVEQMIVTEGGQPRRIDVPVEVPEGVKRQAVDEKQSSVTLMGAFGGQKNYRYARMPVVAQPSPSAPKAKGRRGGGGGGSAGGMGSGTAAGVANSPAPMANSILIDAADGDDAARVLTPQEKRRAELQTKLHPSLLALIDRLKNRTAPVATEANFVRDGKAELQIWLTDKTEQTLAQLKQLGFEVVLDPKTSKVIIGRLSIEKLEALADLKVVRYVAPQLSN